MAVNLGIDCKAYYSTTLMAGTPTWVLIPGVSDVKVPMAHGEAQLKDRAAGWVRYAAAMTDASVTLRLTRNLGDSVYEVLRGAFTGKTVTAFAFMSGAVATVGSEGLQFDGQIFQFDVDESNEELNFIDVTIKPAAASPTSPVYTEISS